MLPLGIFGADLAFKRPPLQARRTFFRILTKMPNRRRTNTISSPPTITFTRSETHLPPGFARRSGESSSPRWTHGARRLLKTKTASKSTAGQTSLPITPRAITGRGPERSRPASPIRASSSRVIRGKRWTGIFLVSCAARRRNSFPVRFVQLQSRKSNIAVPGRFA